MTASTRGPRRDEMLKQLQEMVRKLDGASDYDWAVPTFAQWFEKWLAEFPR